MPMLYWATAEPSVLTVILSCPKANEEINSKNMYSHVYGYILLSYGITQSFWDRKDAE